MTDTDLDHRPDGWPICPICEEDELGAISVPYQEGHVTTMGEYQLHDLFCYRCGKVTVKAGWS